MLFWGLKNCDTCNKARKALARDGREIIYIDVRGDGVKQHDIERFFETFGEALINRRSTTWRTLSEEDRSKAPVALLMQHPTLMKRPVIEEDQKITLGWDEKTRTAWLDSGA